MKKQLKTQTVLVFGIGGLCMGISLLTKPFFNIPQDLADFIKGLGVGLIIASFFVQWKSEQKTQH
ncbi:MAG: hypothetical protein R2812_00925 [Gelidibacter sp.]|nr:hypothetical protein [Gelidibacter sp.]